MPQSFATTQYGMWRYHQYLPIQDATALVSIGEGDTPLVEIESNVFLKLEQLNPTGSYKDRFASSALSWMQETGLRRCLATSSGNTGSALAAYSARAGIPCEIYLTETTPAGKLTQMAAYGASLRRVRGTGKLAAASENLIARLARKADREGAALLISAFTYAPKGMEGVKSMAFEIVDQIGRADDVFVPVGGGGLLTAVYRGFKEYREAGRCQHIPRIHAVQPAGCATVVAPLLSGAERCENVEECTSNISGLQVNTVIDADLALEAVRSTGGRGYSLPDPAIFAAQRILIRNYGIYTEPAGATAYAGLLAAQEKGNLSASSRAVCVVTGHGFKDGNSVDRLIAEQEIPLIDPQEV